MEIVPTGYMSGDPRLIEQIVYELKSQGIFDQFRKECIADVDTKPAYQNLRQRVEGSVNNFLQKQKFSGDMNKNQIREQLRKNISESGFLETGVERIVDQVVNPKINTVFLPKVEDVVYRYLGLEKPTNDTKKELKVEVTDLLPEDLEAVSPESVHDQTFNSCIDKKEADTEALDGSLNSSNAKTEDESPDFEPLEENTKLSLQEENTEQTGPSLAQSIEEGKYFSSTLESFQDVSQSSKNSHDLSVEMSEENSKMEICEDSNVSSDKHEVDEKSTDTTSEVKKDILEEERRAEEKRDNDIKLSDEKKYDSKKSSDRHKSRSDRKDDKDKRNRSKSESKSKDHKDHKSSSRHASSRDRDKEKKDYRNGKDRVDSSDQKNKSEKSRDGDRAKDGKDKSYKTKDGDKDKSQRDKERTKSDKDRSRSSTSSKYSKDSGSNSKSSSKDKDRSGDRSQDKDSSKSKDRDSSKSSRDKDKLKSSSSSSSKDKKHSSSSRSSDKYKRSSDKDKKSSSTKREKDKKPVVDDHYSSKEKKGDRRSTDRDSNDGSGKTSRQNSFIDTLGSKASSKESSEVFSSGSGDSNNSDRTDAPVNEADSDNNAKDNSLEIQTIKYNKPKLACNIQEAMKIMKIRKQLARLERKNQLSLTDIQYQDAGTSDDKGERVSSAENANVETNTEGETRSPQLTSQQLSMESFKALEAKLAEEMSSVSCDTYGEEDDNFEYSSVSFSPTKKRYSQDSINEVVEEQLKNPPTIATISDCNGEDNEKENKLRNEDKAAPINKSNTDKFGKKYLSNLQADTNNTVDSNLRSKEERRPSDNRRIAAFMSSDDTAPCYYFERVNSRQFGDLEILRNYIKNMEAAIEKSLSKTTSRKRKIDNEETNLRITDYRKKHISEQSKEYVYNSDVPHNQNFNLPLSPAESDKSGEHKKEEPLTVKTKRTGRVSTGRGNERYSNEDLYKPRPVFNSTSSRRRGKSEQL